MNESVTFLDALVRALVDAARYNPLDQDAPAAILWPDEAREWETLGRSLREHLPLLTVGLYLPADSTGPASWVRCMLARTLPDPLPQGVVPVVYLPGINSRQIRDAEHGTGQLALLAELRYRCVLWTQSDGRDWTAAAFLQDSLGIQMRNDATTQKALGRALDAVAPMSVSDLRDNAPWKARDFDDLIGLVVETGPPLREQIDRGESAVLEFKSTARCDAETGKAFPALEQVIVKTVAGFLNSERPGTLLIGVRDDKSICGIETDWNTFSKPSDRNRDGYERWLMTLLLNACGQEFGRYISVTFHAIDSHDICRVTAYPAPWAAIVKKDGKKDGEDVFYLRTGNATNSLQMRAALAYYKKRWG